MLHPISLHRTEKVSVLACKGSVFRLKRPPTRLWILALVYFALRRRALCIVPDLYALCKMIIKIPRGNIPLGVSVH